MAPVFSTTNIATDHNQLVMDTMKKVALRHNLVCLLHEKPFAGVNGSGKHNNWSMSTDDGQNLLDPGSTPHENAQFLLFLCAVIKAVDEYSDLLRASIASAGNDHRLGANEAPPAIVSIYLGEQLEEILHQLENGGVTSTKKTEVLKIGVSTLPPLPKDTTDRNRTSPFAFTGNKFEFRMVGSSASIAGPNFVLNTIVAESLSQFADRLEKADDLDSEIQAIIKDVAKNNKRIIFNGNNYSEEWVQEAERRGLPNLKSTVDAVKAIIAEKNINVFEKHKVLSRVELQSRYEINLENYVKTLNIEALTMLEMAKKEILPASIEYTAKLANSINSIKSTGIDADISAQTELLKKVGSLVASFKKNIDILESTLEKASALHGDTYELAKYYKDEVLSQMNALRADGDALESIVDASLWPFPTYGDLLFKI